jgi:hypothetical protein
MKHFLVLTLLLLAAFVPISRAQDKATFPTDDEIQLLLTQTDRAMQQYKPLIDQEELQLGKRSAEAVVKDRQVIQAVETVVQALTKQPQGFNSPAGFAFFEWLDDATRNALLCSQTAMSQAAMLMMEGNARDALPFMHLSQSCMDTSNLIYTVSENAGSLYDRYVKAEQDLANKCVSVAEKCNDALKKAAPEKKP